MIVDHQIIVIQINPLISVGASPYGKMIVDHQIIVEESTSEENEMVVGHRIRS
jgi:hypothetical protein